MLRRGDGLSDRGGMLRARAPADQPRLERLVGAPLPASGAAVGGSMLLRRSVSPEPPARAPPAAGDLRGPPRNPPPAPPPADGDLRAPSPARHGLRSAGGAIRCSL
ncbi:MAG: hypothetical protein OXG35_27600 [Acidobacteria bacterium]|nr:hypothetical protein [Acidobacteriota bacterium]